MSSKMALPVALAVVVFLAVWPAGNLLAQNCPGCSEPAKVVHPNGFGALSYARWKPNVGLTDSGGSNNFAMYMQHLTPPTDAAAGKAVVAVEGFDSLSLGPGPGQVSHLEFWVRTMPNPSGAECQLLSPRWSVINRVGSVDTPMEFGCLSLTGVTTATTNGNTYLQRTVDFLLTVPGEIVSLAILFDGGPPSEILLAPFTHIDNIIVCTGGPCTCTATGTSSPSCVTSGQAFIWTRPADNGAN